MRGPKPEPLTLSDAERKELEVLVRRHGHLLQLNDSRLFFGLLGSPRTGFIGFMGIPWLSDPDQVDRERSDLLPVNVGNRSSDARTGSDELESDSDLLDDLKQGFALRGRALG